MRSAQLTDDVRRFGGTRRTSGDSTDQSLVIRSSNNTNAERTSHVEKDDTVDGRVERLGHYSSRVLDFTADDRQVVRTDNGEARPNDGVKDTAEGGETGETAKGTGGLPESETVLVADGVTAAHCDEGVEGETDHEEDFGDGDPELKSVSNTSMCVWVRELSHSMLYSPQFHRTIGQNTAGRGPMRRYPPR